MATATVMDWRSGVKEGRDLIGRFFNRYIRIMMLFFPLTSFLLIPSIQGTTVIVVMAGMLAGLLAIIPVGQRKFLFMKELFVFFCVAAFFSISSQFINLVYDIRLNEELVLINKGQLLNTFYRTSHITQTFYLIACFVIYLFVKYFADEKIIGYIYWGLRLLCFYAIYEWVYFLLTGQSGDFVTNRTFGENDKEASLFQTTQIAGFQLLRMKGYTGEPSMFSFTIVPFWVLAVALKRYFDQTLLFICMILTFATTSYMSIVLFLGFWFIYKKKYKQLVYFGLLIVVILIILQLDVFRPVLDNIYSKVFEGKMTGEDVSSKQRSRYFYDHMEYWNGLNGLSQLAGIGFGYVRSTDFLSTVLVNNGILGLGVFSWFVLWNLFVKITPKSLGVYYKVGLVLTYFAMLASVPEFAYPSFWIYIALGFILQKRGEERPGSEPAVKEKSRVLRPAGVTAVVLLAGLVLPCSAQQNNTDFVWGVNGHPITQHNYRAKTWEDQIAYIKDLQLDSYRFDVLVEKDGRVRNTESYSKFTRRLHADSILPFPVLRPLGLKGLDAEETYKASFEQGRIFGLRHGEGLTVVEVGNEEETKLILSPKMDGTKASHYDLDKAAVTMAKLGGFIDGLKSVMPSVQVSISFTWVHFYYLELLKEHGVDYDIIGCHWYSNMGDITKVRDPYGDVLTELHKKYGKPIWVSEFNFHNGTLKADFDRQNRYVTKSLRKILDHGVVRGFFFYELFDQTALKKRYPYETDYGLLFRGKGPDEYLKKDVYQGYKEVVSGYKTAVNF